jgi:N-methylhydantoinase B
MPASEEIFQEGLRIPPVKIVKKGVFQDDLLNLILSNVRTPEERTGDLQAQLAANRLGIQRLTEIIQNFGTRETQEQALVLLDYSEQMMRSVIHKIPDGQYHFFDFLEDDGITTQPIKIKATIRIRKSNAVIDFSGTDLQVKGCVNGPYAVTLSSVFYVFCCLAGFEIPINAGIMRPIKVFAPEGTIVNARPPAAVVGGNVELSQRIVDVLFGAFAKALPRSIPAASQGTMNNLTIGGFDPFHQKQFTYYETLAGGMGAPPTCDGLDAVHTHMTNTLNTPIEAIEHTFPFRVKKYRIRRGSGGKGRYQGGEGLIREIEFLSDAQVTVLSERRKLSPYGLAGGGKGKTGKNLLFQKGRKMNLPGKCSFKVNPGDVLSIHTPGGGGYGKPQKR